MPVQRSNPTVTPRGAQPCLDEAALIPSSYGQLIFLARLIDPDTGRYGFYESGGEPSGEQVDGALRRFHEKVFDEWIRSTLQHKMADIELYIAGLAGVNRVELIDAWLRLTPYKNLVPGSIQGPERDKHVSDFEAILGLLKNVYGVRDPGLRGL